MKKLLAIFYRAGVPPHDDMLRANQFREVAPFSVYRAMLPQFDRNGDVR